MADLEVISRTQRIIIDPQRGIVITNAGPVGPQGPSAKTSASGTQEVPSIVWILDVDMGYFPAGLKFYSLDGDTELIPEEIQTTTVNRYLALWPEPIAGKWFAS